MKKLIACILCLVTAACAVFAGIALNESKESSKQQTINQESLARIEELEAQNAAATELAERLQALLAQSSADLSAVNDLVELLQALRAKDAEDLSAANTLIEELQEQAALRAQEALELSNRLAQALQELSASAALTEQLHAQVASSIQSIDVLSAQLEQALAELDSSTALVGQQQAQIIEDALEIAKLLERLEQALAALDALQAEYDALKNESSVTTPESFATDSWATIAANPDFYNIGDEREEEWTEGEITTIVILGKNHDEVADGSGKKAALTCGTKTLLKESAKMNSTNTSQGGWDASEMRTVVMPALFASLPSDLRAVIKTVNKPTANGSQESGGVIANSQDKLWLFSRAEISATSATTTLEGEGTIYEYWSTRDANSSRKKYYKTTADAWWTRSPHYTSTSGSFLTVSASGSFTSGAASSGFRISFGFCVGNAA